MMDNIETETEMKMTALMDSKYPDYFFMNEVAKSDMNSAMNLAIHIFNKHYKKDKKHRLYKLKLSNVMKPFVDEYFKRFSHKHMIILNIITNGIKGYWINLYKKHHKEIEREQSFTNIMKELDHLLKVSIPKIDERLKNLGIKKKEVEVVKCSCGGILCFCVDLKGNYIR